MNPGSGFSTAILALSLASAAANAGGADSDRTANKGAPHGRSDDLALPPPNQNVIG